MRRSRRSFVSFSVQVARLPSMLARVDLAAAYMFIRGFNVSNVRRFVALLVRQSRRSRWFGRTDHRRPKRMVCRRRPNQVALGADAVTEAVLRDQALLVVVATDAAAAAELSAVRRAVAEGRCVAWGTKQVLAASCSSAASSKRVEGLGVVAIFDDRIAAAFRAAVHAAAALSTLSSGNTKRVSGARPMRQEPSDADVGDSVVDAAGGSELSILERGA